MDQLFSFCPMLPYPYAIIRPSLHTEADLALTPRTSKNSTITATDSDDNAPLNPRSFRFAAPTASASPFRLFSVFRGPPLPHSCHSFDSWFLPSARSIFLRRDQSFFHHATTNHNSNPRMCFARNPPNYSPPSQDSLPYGE